MSHVQFQLTIENSGDEAQVQIFLPEEAFGWTLAVLARTLGWLGFLHGGWYVIADGTRRPFLVHFRLVMGGGAIPNCGPIPSLRRSPLRCGGWSVFRPARHANYGRNCAMCVTPHVRLGLVSEPYDNV